MFCRKCGNNLSNAAVFCNSCGTTTNIPVKEEKVTQKPGYTPQSYQRPHESKYESKPYMSNSLGNNTAWSGNNSDDSGLVVASIAIIFFVLFIIFIVSIDDTSDTDDTYSNSDSGSSCCDIDLKVEHLDSSYSDLSYVIYFNDSQQGSGTLNYGESQWYRLCTGCSGSHTIEVYWGDGDDCYTEVTLGSSHKTYGCTNY
mgnify:CR=1 FL=1